MRPKTLGAFLFVLLCMDPTNGQPITEFPLPWADPGVTEIVSGANSTLWFIESHRNRIGSITTSGYVSDFDLGLPAGSAPVAITQGPDGNIWFTATSPSGSGHVGRIAGGIVTLFPLPSAFSSPDGIGAALDGNVWFATHGGALGGISTSGTLTGPWGTTSFPLTCPTRLAVTSSGDLWLAEQFLVGSASAYSKIARWNVSTHVGFEYSLPGNPGPITDMCVGPYGYIWFVAGGGLPSSSIGFVTPFGGTGLIPAAGIRIAAGPDGALWVTDPFSRSIRRATTSGVVTSLAPPSSSGALWGITAGPDGNVWYADGSRIGRISTGATQTLSIPASSSIHGASGAFFQTDLWLTNRSYTQTTSVTLTYYCYLGASCYGTQRTVAVPARQSLYLQDVVGAFFGSPETAGPVQVSYPSGGGPITAQARVYSPSFPSPTFGASIEAVKPAAAKSRALFVGLASNGGDLSSGFRSNAGVFNPNTDPVSVVFSLLSADGKALGQYLSIVVPPLSAVQINDIFSRVGAGSVVTRAAMLNVIAAAPIFPYVTVIDNQSNDFTYLPASEDEWPLVSYVGASGQIPY